MKPDEDIRSAAQVLLARIVGDFAWNVRDGVGSFLTLDFGAPRVTFSTATRLRRGELLGLRDRTVRDVHLRGAYHLWFYQCAWQARLPSATLDASTASRTQLAELATLLTGQRLTSIIIAPDATCRFEFDLETTLHTHPLAPDDDQWLLYDEAAGSVLTLRGDGGIALGPSNSGVPATVHPLDHELTIAC